MIVAVLLVAVLVLILLSTYNGLTHQRKEVRSAWAEIDEQLKQRYTLVPVLITQVQRSGGEATAQLPALSAAKNQAAVAFNPSQLAGAESVLSQAIEKVIGSLVSDSEFEPIRSQIAANETKITAATHRYNDRVDSLNIAMSSFPNSVTARLIGLKPQPRFEIE